MKTERDLFEDLPYIKSRLDDVFFIDEENTYLPHQWDDADSVNNMHFINGAWYSWQARVPEGYVVVPVEPSDYMKCTVRDFGPDIEDYENMSKWDWEKLCAEIYKAMLEAVEK